MLADQEDVLLVMAVLGRHESMLNEELAPTTLEGVYPHVDFYQGNGGFDFWEFFRFEGLTSWSCGRLQLPEAIGIYR